MSGTQRTGIASREFALPVRREHVRWAGCILVATHAACAHGHPANVAEGPVLTGVAQAQLEEAREFARTISTPEEATRLGYKRLAPKSMPDLNPFVGEHWMNARYLRAPAFDLRQPGYVMFYPFPGDSLPTLVGLAYAKAQPVDQPPPDGFAGDADRWHLHLPCSKVAGMGTVLAYSTEQCLALGGQPAQSKISMVHVWVNHANPDGPFADFNPALPFIATGLAPPTTADLADPHRSTWLRRLGLALGESFGGQPRLGAWVDRRSDSPFSRRVAPQRDRIRALAERMRQAQAASDSAGYERLAAEAIAEWQVIRRAYLESADSEALRRLLEEWLINAERLPTGMAHAVR